MRLAPDLDLTVLEELEPGPPACQSYLHNIQYQMPAHPADWLVQVSCGHAMFVCEDRRARAEAEGVWRCTLGCQQRHVYHYMIWTPITKAH